MSDAPHGRPRVLALLALALLAACSSGLGSEGAVPNDVTAVASLPADDEVELTLYFRAGVDNDYLVPVRRSVAVGPPEQLARRAVDELVAGPRPDDGTAAPTLPRTARILGLRIEAETAFVDFSSTVITDADLVGRTPKREALALAAVANTLTEFPTIRRVRLTVEGRASGAVRGVDVAPFWGGWGLPQFLVRDETLIGPPPDGEGVPDLDRFSTEPQTVAGSGNDEDVRLTKVRTTIHSTHVRVSITFSDSSDGAERRIPRTTARLVGDAIVVELDDASASNVRLDAAPTPGADDDSHPAVRIEPSATPGGVRVVVTPARPQSFWLHALSKPTRVVLDVRK